MMMMPTLLADELGKHLADDFRRLFGSSHLEEAVGCLNVTAAGRQWIANLHNHVFCTEHAFALMGPQR